MFYYFDVSDIKPDVDIEQSSTRILLDGKPLDIELSRQKTGFGYKLFLQCPICMQRRSKLYIDANILKCRECIPGNIYRRIQHTPNGGDDFISYKMSRFAEINGIEFIRHPFRYYNYLKPKYKHEEKWVINITILQALENMRTQTIQSKKRWSKETLSSVLNGTNLFLHIYEIYYIYEQPMNWDIGARDSVNLG